VGLKRTKRIKNKYIRLPDFSHMRSKRQMRKKNLRLHSRLRFFYYSGNYTARFSLYVFEKVDAKKSMDLYGLGEYFRVKLNVEMIKREESNIGFTK
jgi:hypothetical protein